MLSCVGGGSRPAWLVTRRPELNGSTQIKSFFNQAKSKLRHSPHWINYHSFCVTKCLLINMFVSVKWLSKITNTLAHSVAGYPCLSIPMMIHFHFRPASTIDGGHSPISAGDVRQPPCTSMAHLKQLHAHLVKSGTYHRPAAAAPLLSFAATSSRGNPRYALLLFSRIHYPNLFAWNTIIRALSNNSSPSHAISLFLHMLHTAPPRPDRRTFPSLFKACSQLGIARELGAQLHAMCVKLGFNSDPYVRNSMISMYAVCGCLSSSCLLFEQVSGYDVVAWNSMVFGLARAGRADDARELFDNMPTRNDVSWSSMISGYVRSSRFQEALELFHDMQMEGVEPSLHTMVSLLHACGRVGSIQQGQWIHDYIVQEGMEMNVIVATAIIDMYCKCGFVGKACHVFESISVRGLSSWNSLISGLAMHGHAEEAIRLFSRLESSGIRPDDVSFLGILTACNHSGLFEEARYFFSRMVEYYGIEPELKHYGCMVDVLGRAGCLGEAQELIRTMPMVPDALIWGSLLASSRTHGNIEIVDRVANEIMKLQTVDAGSYILLSNSYAALGRFEEAVNVRRLMGEEKLRKEPGCSMIEVDGVVNEFLAGSSMHPQTRDINLLLESIGLVMEDAGQGQRDKLAVELALDWECQCS